MDTWLELGGLWLARAYAGYGIAFLVLPMLSFLYVILLAALVWSASAQVRGRQAWAPVPAGLRKWTRLILELTFGLINPIIYLAVLTPSFPWLQSDAAWFVPLTTAAWILLASFWILRLFGSAIRPQSRTILILVRAMLVLALACLLAYIVKDARLPFMADGSRMGPDSRAAMKLGSIVLRVSTLYLIPLILLWQHVWDAWHARPALAGPRTSLFLVPSRASRAAVATVLALAIVTTASALHKRSDASVRTLVSKHRELIRAAARQYDVDPRLIGAIVYVTHRDQLAPFRDEVERIVMAAWAEDGGDQYGGNQWMLNKPLDLSVGIAQIKPRTALTASLLATGRTPEDLPRPQMFLYRDAEPVSAAWRPVATEKAWEPPFPVPVARKTVVSGLLDARVNLATCAMILALYQHQWEAADSRFSLRSRPEILATLYQIGFARSKPHDAPQSNAFGLRVREVFEQPWLDDLFSSARLAGRRRPDTAVLK
jgi:hypothetical protein